MAIRKIKVGILTFSDGRKYIHDTLVELNRNYQNKLANALEATGEVEAVQAEDIIWNAETARTEGRRMLEKQVDITILNYAIWAFPNLAAIATNFAPGPYLLFCNIHPSEPGMVGMLACAGTMDQLGLTYSRVWGDINDKATLGKVMSYVRAAGAVNHIKGETYGLFGGRPLGMYTAVANQDQWRKIFGVDVQHIEQYDIVRVSETIDDDRVNAGLNWLEERVKEVKYNGNALTPGKTEETDSFLSRHTGNH